MKSASPFFLAIVIAIAPLAGYGDSQTPNESHIAPPEDVLEQEADRVADSVLKDESFNLQEERSDQESEPEPKPEPELPDKKTISAYIGNWKRAATYAHGTLAGQTFSILSFNPDGTYSSVTDLCATSGTHEETAPGRITMIMTQSSCPGGVGVPFTVNSTYTVEEKGGMEVMTIITGPVEEIYLR
jgi:hypothetical protein